MILVEGKRYRASIRLGLFQQVASNGQIRSLLENNGFKDVSVSGGGRDRQAEGTWDKATGEQGDIPDEVKSLYVVS